LTDWPLSDIPSICLTLVCQHEKGLVPPTLRSQLLPTRAGLGDGRFQGGLFQLASLTQLWLEGAISRNQAKQENTERSFSEMSKSRRAQPSMGSKRCDHRASLLSEARHGQVHGLGPVGRCGDVEEVDLVVAEDNESAKKKSTG
jgi:hypothetical protein